MKIFYRIKELIKLYLLDIKAKNSLADFANEYNIINEILEKIGNSLSKKDRKELFSWNNNVDYWQELSKKEVITEIKKYFFKYKDKFTIFECK